MSNKFIDNFVSEVNIAIKDYGYKSILTSTLMSKMGYKKRSDENIKKITEYFRNQNLYIYPELNLQRKWKESLRIYNFPVEILGDLFDNEAELEAFIFKKQKYIDFGLQKVEVQYSAQKTRDKMDMLGFDKSNNPVVLEFKNKEGGKAAVEQVFRYISQLRNDKKNKKVSGVLVTGVRGLETAHALCGMDAENLRNFSWYLYKYNLQKQTISFHEVKMNFIRKFLK